MAGSPLYGLAPDRRALMRDRLAQQMLAQGVDTSPIQSPWQGVARLAQALMGGQMMRRGEEETAKRETDYASGLNAALMGEGGAGDIATRLGASGNKDLMQLATQFRIKDIDGRQTEARDKAKAAEEAKLPKNRYHNVGNSMFDFQGADPTKPVWTAPDKPTGTIAQYNLAMDEGYKGSILEFLTAIAAAGRAPQQPQRDRLVDVHDPNSPTGISLVPESAARNRAAPLPRGSSNTMPPALPPEDRTQMGSTLGVPVLPVNPLSTLPPKAAEALAREQAKATEKQLTEMRDQSAEARSSMAPLNRFGQLLDGGQTTGGAYAIPGVPAVAGMFSPDVREMRSLADQIAPTMRQSGSGATSDFDARMFQSATVGVDKDPTTNRNIIAGRKAVAQLAQEKLAFMEAYATTNSGTLRGADEHWQRYLNANPIFDPMKPTKPTINERRRPWADFFRGGGQAPAPNAPPGAGAIRVYNPATGKLE